ncbi:hypothetical protein Bca101_075629 [Brassica carinata]
MIQDLNCDIVFRKALTSLSFSGRTTSSETASTMETESESDLQDYRSCAFDYRSCAFTPSRFTQGPRTIASVLSFYFKIIVQLMFVSLPLSCLNVLI